MDEGINRSYGFSVQESIKDSCSLSAGSPLRTSVSSEAKGIKTVVQKNIFFVLNQFAVCCCFNFLSS